MSTVLLIYPRSNVLRPNSTPPLGIARLCGCLRQHGVAASQLDLSVPLGLSGRGDYRLRHLLQASKVPRDAETKWLLANRNSPGVAQFHDEIFGRLIASLTRYPSIVGFSLYGYDQLPFALELGRRFRSFCGTRFVLGGPYVRMFAADLARDFPFVDHVVVGPGEGALVQLLAGNYHQRVLVSDADATPSSILGRPTRSDFSSVDFRVYNNPVPMYPALIYTGGCIFRCSFCTYGLQGVRLRPREESDVLHEFSRGFPANGGFDVDFNDSAINAVPAFSVSMIRKAQQRVGPFTWVAMATPRTLDSETLTAYSGLGCRELRYGLESASGRIQGTIRKRVDLGAFVRLLKAGKRRGVHNTVLLIAGFPGETDEDLDATLTFVAENARVIDTVKVSTFQLQLGSEMQRRPGKHGLVNVRRVPLSVVCEFDEVDGLLWHDKREQQWGHRRAIEAVARRHGIATVATWRAESNETKGDANGI